MKKIEFIKKNLFPKHAVLFWVVVLVCVVLLCTWHLFFTNRHVLGGIGLVLALLANLYTVRKYFILFGYRRWQRNFEKSAENFLKAQEELQRMEKESKRAMEDKGDDILDKYSLLEEYQTQIVCQEQDPIMERRHSLANLDSWHVFHIYLGFLAILVCLGYLGFSPRHSFVTHILFLGLWMILLTGLGGVVLSKLASGQSLLPQNTSLEYLEYLEEMLWKNVKESQKKGSSSIKKALEELLLSLKKNGEDGFFQKVQKIQNFVSSEEKQAFDMAVVSLCQWHRVFFILRPSQSYRISQRVFFFLHIPFAVCFLVFSILYALGFIYYG